MSATPPLKRHPSLQPLSRDHYVGLVHAQRLIKSADAQPADRRHALAEFLDAWATEIAEHFADEERLLLPLMSPEQGQRLQQEHDRLRTLAEESRQHRRQIDPGDAWVRDLGQLLNDHIRWEERQLFPAIEQAAGDDKLADLARATEVIEASRPRTRGGSVSPD